jgi:hypothetical protein
MGAVCALHGFVRISQPARITANLVRRHWPQQAVVTPVWSDGVLDEYAHRCPRATIETGVQVCVG